MRSFLPLLALLAGCSGGQLDRGPFEIVAEDDGTLTISHLVYGTELSGVRLHSGTGSTEVDFQYGAFRFYDETETLKQARRVKVTRIELIDVYDDTGDLMGVLEVVPASEDALALVWTPATSNRAGLSAPCEADDHFLGLGAHALDVDHVGEAFHVWVSEPGIGKVDTDEYPDDWFFTGTRHASSFPMPWILRPQRSEGLLINTTARVDVDLCATDPERFSVTAWAPQATFLYVASPTPLDAVRELTAFTGRLDLPPPWVFGPWNDAIRGADRVREVATKLREAGAPSSVIWTEDWKGGVEGSFGYRLLDEWFVDETLYPEPKAIADELEAKGFKWFSYFAPFLEEGTVTYEDAVANDVLIKDANGDPYMWPGFDFQPTTMVDLTSAAGREWAQEYMQASLDLGFDGWMADFAEWLPTDARIAEGDAWLTHNAYPVLWQLTNQEVLGGQDATFFVRSGWSGTSGIAPVVWAGDQRTSFEGDDGFPTVMAMGLGMSASGVPVFTHDVAGYNSVGNPPSDKELWFRWAWLGAYSPILRTHHGAFEEDNWQFDTDDETLQHWATVATEHTRLFPYRYGLAARAAADGTPMLLPIGLLFEGEDVARTDAWMLGEALLVAPVLEQGATGREVDLPDDVQWVTWPGLEPASSGWHDAAIDEISVFAASGQTIPTFTDIPETLFDATDAVGLSDVDGKRTVYLIGGGGEFAEADGTTYRPSGTPSGAAETTQTLTSGSIEVGGVTLSIEGDVERAYTVVVVP